MAKLALTEWLVTKAWQPFLDAKAQTKMADSFKRFADIHLSRHAAELNSDFRAAVGRSVSRSASAPDPRYRQHFAAGRLLRRECGTGLAGELAGPAPACDGQRIEIEHFRNEAIFQEPFWLHSGKR